MAARSRPVGREVTRLPLVPAELEAVELAGLDDHDGWTEALVTGEAVAADAEHVSFSRCRLRGVRLTGAQLYKLDLTDVVLEQCDLAGAVLDELHLDRVAFDGCRLSGADLGGAVLRDVSLTDCQLDEASLRMVRSERLTVTGGNAQGLDLYEAWLTASTWDGVELTGAKLSRAKLDRARLHRSTLRDLEGARALAGATIDASQVVDAGMALLIDLGVRVED